MLKKTRIDQFTEECKGLRSEMSLNYRNVSPSFEFSNTGRRGTKYFTITLVELLTTLKDIRTNLSQYEAAKDYVEGRMRDLFSQTITSKTINALSTVQTLPLFSLLNKVIYVANGLDSAFNEKRLNLNADLIENAILYIESQIPDNDAYLESISKVHTTSNSGGENIIYYGAPGVGKSYQIDQRCNLDNSIRTVFHPDSQYSDFTGCLKPTMLGENVVYEFRPGPFTLAFIKASLAPEKMFYLVIEEINRASSAAVFGELFQLLDRSASGESCYEITLADPDMVAFINEKAPSALNGNNIKIPSNLSLYATMNSSDQAVMPMDTAFKRRWKFEYVPIDFSECPHGDIEIPMDAAAPIVTTWKNLAESINEVLEAEEIPEDRLLGPWFMKESELDSLEASANALKGKLLLYLWDDVLRHGDKSLIFADNIMSYGNLIRNLKSGGKIFSRSLEESLKAKQADTQHQDDVENEQGQIEPEDI
ncbi:AAA family ATPase [Alteromonas facilis]|uniref:AAA family ATPase n=1 Tax=Alteromonas facilis TaxID=2048004 RepID=UPI00196A4A9E|nr:AAA family ATPase [Alteromonas facilis]